jgi:hypothetical protein
LRLTGAALGKALRHGLIAASDRGLDQFTGSRLVLKPTARPKAAGPVGRR